MRSKFILDKELKPKFIGNKHDKLTTLEIDNTIINNWTINSYQSLSSLQAFLTNE